MRTADGRQADVGTRRATTMAKLNNDALLDAFKEMTLLELSEFVKQFEETFDVKAAAPMAMAAPAAPGGGGVEEVEEKDEFDVILRSEEHTSELQPSLPLFRSSSRKPSMSRPRPRWRWPHRQRPAAAGWKRSRRRTSSTSSSDRKSTRLNSSPPCRSSDLVRGNLRCQGRGPDGDGRTGSARRRRGGRGRGEGRVRRHPRGRRRQEDPGHQGGPDSDEPRAQGGQAPRF